ncbi:hypothetical protein OH492_08575 [Vibrio chagasii]|nr:hypothetical protein [Vibrio chagasii]
MGLFHSELGVGWLVVHRTGGSPVAANISALTQLGVAKGKQQLLKWSLV